MNEDQKGLGIEETLDIFNCAIKFINDLVVKKMDDGKISFVDASSVAVSNFSSEVKALIGSHKVIAEMSDLSADEGRMLAEKALELGKSVMNLVAKKAE